MDRTEQIRDIIKQYRITEAEGGKIRIENVSLIQKNNASEMIKAKKPEILDFLREEKRKAQEAFEIRESKIRAIEGLQEIEECISAWRKWDDDFHTMMETGRSYMLEKRPTVEIADLRAKYPRADAYLKAKYESEKSNYELAAIGHKALEKIINGEDYNEVMEEMEIDKSKFVESHIWD